MANFFQLLVECVPTPILDAVIGVVLGQDPTKRAVRVKFSCASDTEGSVVSLKAAFCKWAGKTPQQVIMTVDPVNCTVEIRG